MFGSMPHSRSISNRQYLSFRADLPFVPGMTMNIKQHRVRDKMMMVVDLKVGFIFWFDLSLNLLEIDLGTK